MVDKGTVQYILHLKGREKATSIGRHLRISCAFGALGAAIGFFLWASYSGAAFGFLVVFAIYDASVAVIRQRVDDELIRLEYTSPEEYSEAIQFLATQHLYGKHSG